MLTNIRQMDPQLFPQSEDPQLLDEPDGEAHVLVRHRVLLPVVRLPDHLVVLGLHLCLHCS